MENNKLPLILYNKPPASVWNNCHKFFEIDDKATIYTYNGHIYNPAGIDIPVEIIEHEKIHIKQQEETGADEWWKLYFEDEIFRYTQEVEAYGKQLAVFINNHKDKNLREKYAATLAGLLSSPMYKIQVSWYQCLKDIKTEAKQYYK